MCGNSCVFEFTGYLQVIALGAYWNWVKEKRAKKSEKGEDSIREIFLSLWLFVSSLSVVIIINKMLGFSSSLKVFWNSLKVTSYCIESISSFGFCARIACLFLLFGYCFSSFSNCLGWLIWWIKRTVQGAVF